MEAVEGAATLSSVPERQAETAGTEPPLSRAPQGRTRTKNRHPQHREGHLYKIFFRAAATVPAAMRSSSAHGDRPCSGSVPTPAATLWSGFWSGSGAGANDATARPGPELRRKRPDPYADKTLPISSGHIALGLSLSLSSACAQQGEEGGVRTAQVALCSLFFFHKDERRGTGISSTRASLRAAEGGATGTGADGSWLHWLKSVSRFPSSW